RLIEQIPGILSAIGAAVDFRPAKLNVRRRTVGAEPRHRPAIDRLGNECRYVRRDHCAAAWIGGRGGQSELRQFRRRCSAADDDVVGAGRFELDLALLFRNAFTLSPAVLTAFRMLFTVTAPPDVTVAVPVPSPIVMVLPLATGNDEAPVRLETLPTTRLVNIGLTVKFAGVSSSDPGIDETADVGFG